MKKEKYFTPLEIILWSGSSAAVIISSVLFGGGYPELAASLTGISSLIFAAKGNPAGPALMIIFSVIYGMISFGFAYYGEMITYMGMTLPMSVFSLVSWLKNPYSGDRSQVKVNRISGKEIIFLVLLTAGVTAVFCFILKHFGTANLIPSTVSVATSFAAAYLTFRRSPFFAAAYAANDVILIILWSLASAENTEYIPVTVCFAVFLANDIYGFVNWRKMENSQK